jgi:hypothetical protein
VFAPIAADPTAVLFAPVVLTSSASFPIAVLFAPVVFAARAPEPNAVFVAIPPGPGATMAPVAETENTT